jgi:hypothetical protein
MIVIPVIPLLQVPCFLVACPRLDGGVFDTALDRHRAYAHLVSDLPDAQSFFV